LEVVGCICLSNEREINQKIFVGWKLNVKLIKKMGGARRGQPKMWGVHGPPTHALEPSLYQATFLNRGI